MELTNKQLYCYWKKVNIIPFFNQCWAWTGGVDGKGYGQFRVGHKKKRAHRLSYELMIGIIPAGLDLDHVCRNIKCVNPYHLEPVTRQLNIIRGKSSALNGRKSSNFPGVSWDKKRKKWKAYSKGIDLGRFNTEKEAYDARKEAAQ